jgi:ArsR family transcriptional regulator
MTATLDRIEPAALRRAANVIKCLGHPLRLRLLEALEHGERSVSELQEHCRVTQAAVSQQLSTLRGLGIVQPRREANHVYYRITEPKVQHILDCIRECDLRRPARRRSA